VRIHWLLPGIEISGGVICVLRHAAGLQDRGHDVVVYVAQPVDRTRLGLLPRDVKGVVLEPAPPALPEADIQLATHYSTVLAVAQSPARLRAHFVQHVETLFAHEAPNPELLHAFTKMALSLPVYRIVNSSWARKTVHRIFGYCPDIALNAGPTPMGPPEDPAISLPPVIVSFVHPARWKGSADAYNALQLARSLAPELDIQWHVFGSGTVPEHPWVHNHGLVAHDDLEALYRKASAVLFTSWAESYPLPPLEAMAAGAVVVTTPVGLEDYVQEGVNALVVPPRDTRAAANALLDALYASPEQRRHWQLKAQETARRHTWAAAITGFEQALERGLTAGPRDHAREAILSELSIPLITG
jgi:glycosyltransferase involved in cell wall biosynthesis